MRKYFEKSDEDVVSGVIIVSLMVAITVILAAVIGAFVLQLGEDIGPTPPQVRWDWSQQSDTTVQLTHNGGDKVDGDLLFISKQGTSNRLEWTSDLDGTQTLTAGDKTVITDTKLSSIGGLGIGDTVQLIWQPEGADPQIASKYEMK